MALKKQSAQGQGTGKAEKGDSPLAPNGSRALPLPIPKTVTNGSIGITGIQFTLKVRGWGGGSALPLQVVEPSMQNLPFHPH